MSPPMRETAKTVTLQRRLKRSIGKLGQMDPDSDFLGEYRATNAGILRHNSPVPRECGTQAIPGSDEGRT
jgi:hypothetical protein